MVNNMIFDCVIAEKSEKISEFPYAHDRQIHMTSALVFSGFRRGYFILLSRNRPLKPTTCSRYDIRSVMAHLQSRRRTVSKEMVGS